MKTETVGEERERDKDRGGKEQGRGMQRQQSKLRDREEIKEVMVATGQREGRRERAGRENESDSRRPGGSGD